MLKLLSVALLLVGSCNAAFYSIGYYSPENSIIQNDQSVFKDAPSALQVADIYCRLSGLSPLLREDEMTLPMLELAPKNTARPYILEVKGALSGEIRGAVPILEGSAFAYDTVDQSPGVDAVVSELSAHGVSVTAADYSSVDLLLLTSDTEKALRLDKVLRERGAGRPVVILQHATARRQPPQVQSRRLAGSGSRSSVGAVPLSEFQISQYQICLWTGLGFVLLVLAAVCAVANMDIEPDSLLYAKFQSGRTGSKLD